KTSCRSEASFSATAGGSRWPHTLRGRAPRTRSRASFMRIALTANGPGEVAGWLRPPLRSLYRHVDDLEALVFLVPDDYATGSEAEMVREAFPAARVYDPKSYLKFA